jgi:hypothetical protein
MFVAWPDIITIFAFIWFGIGALAAGTMIAVSMGFTGRFPWEAIPIFFFAPVLLLARIMGPFILVIPAVGLAGGMALLIRWAIG